MSELTVSCSPADEGWLCQVTVAENGGQTEHVVSVSRDELARFAGEGREADELVNASFRYLLEREPKEQILRRFAIGDIARYFPSYPREIGRRLSG
ncbi:MAG: hypothetical protein M3N29_09460 [Chloroflexota bacterium]|nr:hypothetical protein [Chloroflexota bacterium]